MATSLENATSYIGAEYSPAATTWIGLTDVQRQQTLVSATRIMDRLAWLGTATHVVVIDGVAQPTSLAWPRADVVIDGVTLDPTKVPDDISIATWELAKAIAANPKIGTTADLGSNIKRAAAGGGVEVEYFAPTSAANGTALRLPFQVMEIISKYLRQPAAVPDSSYTVGGTCVSAFSRRSGFSLWEPE